MLAEMNKIGVTIFTVVPGVSSLKNVTEPTCKTSMIPIPAKAEEINVVKAPALSCPSRPG